MNRNASCRFGREPLGRLSVFHQSFLELSYLYQQLSNLYMDHWEIPAHAFEVIHYLIEETVKTYYWTPEISLGSPYKCVQIKILQTMCKVLKGCG